MLVVCARVAVPSLSCGRGCAPSASHRPKWPASNRAVARAAAKQRLMRFLVSRPCRESSQPRLTAHRVGTVRQDGKPHGRGNHLRRPLRQERWGIIPGGRWGRGMEDTGSGSPSSLNHFGIHRGHLRSVEVEPGVGSPGCLSHLVRSADTRGPDRVPGRQPGRLGSPGSGLTMWQTARVKAGMQLV